MKFINFNHHYFYLSLITILLVFLCINFLRLHSQKAETLDNILFPEIKPYNAGYLKVSEIHEIWYAEYGNPKGVPLVYFHGGPAAGTSKRDMRYYDPKYYRIVLLDQRGAGKSKPFAEMKDNTPQTIISDIERLRNHLKIDKWLVVGQSWGSTLAIAYGETHPNSCLGFIVSGIFLARQKDRDNVWYRMKDIFPQEWEEFENFVTEEERKDLMTSYYKRFMNPDPEIHLPAVKAFIKYDMSAAKLIVPDEFMKEVLSDEKTNLAVSRAFAHFSVNNFFVDENQLVNNLPKIAHLPIIIINGRYDIITRPQTAYDLHKNWPGSILKIVPATGHSKTEVGLSKAIVEASEAMKNLIEINANPIAK